MPTLSSLLLQREVTTLRELDVALARQMSLGGDLPTNLIEVAAVDEGKLLEVIAESVRLPALAPGPLPAPAPSALKTVPADVADRLCVMPLTIEPDALVIAVSEPLPAVEEEELSFALARPLRQKVTTRVRVREAIARHYGGALDRRSERLLARLEGRDDPRPSEAPAPREPGDSMLPPRMPRDGRPVSVAPVISVGATASQPVQTRESSGVHLPAQPALPADLSARPEPMRESASEGTAPAAPRLVPFGVRRRGPFTASMAQEALGGVESHGAILRVAFDFARQYFEYTALFVIHGDLAEGVDAAGPGAGASRIRGIGVPMEIPSILSAARDRKTAVLARPSEDGMDAVLRQDLQRPMTVPVLVVPVTVRNRVVALLYGDEGEMPVQMGDVGDVLALISLVGAALERLLIRRKRLREGGKEGTPLAPPVQAALPPRHDTLSMVRMPWGRGEAASPARTTRQPGAGGPAAIPPAGASLQRPVAAPFPQQDASTLPGMAGRRDTASYNVVQLARSAHAKESGASAPSDADVSRQQAGVSPAAESLSAARLHTEPPATHAGIAPAPHHGFEALNAIPTPLPSPAHGSVHVARVISIGGEPITLVPRRVPPRVSDEDERPIPLVQRASSSPARPAPAQPELPPPPKVPSHPPVSPPAASSDEPAPVTSPYPVVGKPPRQPVSAVPDTMRAASPRSGSMPEIVVEESDAQIVLPDEAPEVTVGESEEDDEILATVMTELERSQPMVRGGEEEASLRDSAASLSPVSVGPRAPPKSQLVSDAGLPPVIVDLEGEAEELLSRLIQASDGKAASEARGELVSMGAAAARTVAKRFPGPIHPGIALDMDPLPPAAECGPVLDVAVALGQASLLRHAMVQELVRITESRESEARMWALLALADIGTSEVVDSALRALMDSDVRLRAIAAKVIASLGGQSRGVGEAMRKSMEQIASSDLTDPEVRLVAIAALGGMRDAEAVPVLIDAAGHPDARVRDASMRALRLLTRADPGDDVSAWRAWWEQSRSRPRLEWLIDALTSASFEQREGAARELAERTGRDFGYRADLPAEARVSVQSRYRAWREQEGKERAL